MRNTIRIGFLASLMMLTAAVAGAAEVQTTFSMMGSKLVVGRPPIACPDVTYCIPTIFTGNVTKNIGGVSSPGVLFAEIFAVTNTAIPLGRGNCYPTDGGGTIYNAQKNVALLEFNLQGWLCDAPDGGYVYGPLTYVITRGFGKFTGASGVGSLNAYSTKKEAGPGGDLIMKGMIVYDTGTP